MKARIFHYTIGQYMPSILRSGIRVATAGVAPGVRPAVWFSTEPFWERTANKAMILGGRIVSGDRQMTAERGGGLYRIEVDAADAPHDWKAYRELSGETPAQSAALAMVARRDFADPRNWRVSFDPIPPERFVAIERMAGEAWQPVGDVSTLTQREGKAA